MRTGTVWINDYHLITPSARSAVTSSRASAASRSARLQRYHIAHINHGGSAEHFDRPQFLHLDFDLGLSGINRGRAEYALRGMRITATDRASAIVDRAKAPRAGRLTITARWDRVINL